MWGQPPSAVRRPSCIGPLQVAHAPRRLSRGRQGFVSGHAFRRATSAASIDALLQAAENSDSRRSREGHEFYSCRKSLKMRPRFSALGTLSAFSATFSATCLGAGFRSTVEERRFQRRVEPRKIHWALAPVRGNRNSHLQPLLPRLRQRQPDSSPSARKPRAGTA